MCNALRLDDMYASLPDLKYRSPPPPLRCSIITGCFCLLFKAFFILSMCWFIRVLAFHSDVSAVPILGYRRRLLLLLFIKLDPALKCGVAWFIMNELNQSFIFWILLRIVLSLIMRIEPTLIKRFSIVDLILDCQLVMNLPLVETILFKYMLETILFKYLLSSVFLETIQSSRHASHSL
jgi:hypothetical protein